MAFTELKVENFTVTDSLVFKNTNSPSQENNYVFCQVRLYNQPQLLSKNTTNSNNNMRWVSFISGSLELGFIISLISFLEPSVDEPSELHFISESIPLLVKTLNMACKLYRHV